MPCNREQAVGAILGLLRLAPMMSQIYLCHLLLTFVHLLNMAHGETRVYVLCQAQAMCYLRQPLTIRWAPIRRLGQQIFVWGLRMVLMVSTLVRSIPVLPMAFGFQGRIIQMAFTIPLAY